ncbi:MAG: NAD(+) synthase [Faecalibacterium sp.]
MKDGFLKAAALSPALRVADCSYNTDQILAELRGCAARGVKLAVFPEFCLTGYTCGDLFLQRTLQQGALEGLRRILDASRELDLIALVGLPVLVRGKLYNCAAAVCGGRLLGLVPKTYLPNYGEFYEKRQFTPGSTEVETVTLCGQEVPFGTSVLFRCRTMPSFVLGVELCEDLWSALPPSTFHALAGATVIANLSASDETVGKAEYRRELVRNQSARLLCGYLYASAGHGESTQDMVFAGHDLIAEDGILLDETEPFRGGCAETELDCQRMELERARNTSFETSAEGYLTVDFDLTVTEAPLTRWIDPAPFVPGDPRRRAERCELILRMQADGLAKRLEHAHAKTAVIGISGGLDSCLALLVAVRAMKQLGRPASDVLAVTMPCFGTTRRTRSNAEILCNELEVSFREINIANTVHSHFADIGQDESVLDVTFENGQARVRTLELMDTANRTGGLVVGTGDLSELALGWATYNGDHMSMYGVNAGVPKTLVRHLVRYEADIADSPALREVLLDILDTPVSPELLPAKDGEISQRTEDLVGPYELHDFYLYQVLRFGFGPAKIFRLAKAAFAGRPEYPDSVLYKWLRNFYWRFFAQQFKRSCLPDGPKIGSVTLSPRGDWRMPSDVCAALWLAELEQLPHEERT